MVEADSLGGGLSITDRVPAFQNIQTFLPLPGMILNPVECLSLVALVIVGLRAGMSKTLGFKGGTLGWPMALLPAIVLLGMIQGQFAGGDMKIALWSVRALLLLFVSYMLTVNLVLTPRQLRILFLIFLAGVALKGLIGLWRYFIDFHMQVQTVETGVPGNALMAHEESFFFLLALFLTGIAYLFRLPQRDRRLCLLTMVIVLIPFLANQRRVSIAALVLGLLLVAMILYILDTERRQAIKRIVLWGLLLAPVYSFLFWGSTSLPAIPLQAVKSEFAPSDRDASSNAYRDIENANLRLTTKDNPLFGSGFGIPMRQEQRLPIDPRSFEWYLYQPHNNLLWLGMATGLFGLTAFLYFVARTTLVHVAALRLADAPERRALYLLGLVAWAGFLAYALLDQGLLSQRMAVVMGVLLGLVASVPNTTPAGSLPIGGNSVEVWRGGHHVGR
jgi:hypothetical protein